MEINTSSFAANDGTKRQLQDLARHILDERDRCKWYFPRLLFDEVPWQMLLVLYVSETSRLSSESLCGSILAPLTAGNRWIDYLAREDLVTQHVEPSDRSRSIVELAPKGLSSLELYLTDRLQRAEERSKTNLEVVNSTRPTLSLGLIALVIAALSAGVTYLLIS